MLNGSHLNREAFFRVPLNLQFEARHDNFHFTLFVDADNLLGSHRLGLEHDLRIVLLCSRIIKRAVGPRVNNRADAFPLVRGMRTTGILPLVFTKERVSFCIGMEVY